MLGPSVMGTAMQKRLDIIASVAINDGDPQPGRAVQLAGKIYF